MTTFKDNEIVNEALKSAISGKNNGKRKRLRIIAVSILMTITIAIVIFKFLPNDQAAAPCAVVAEEIVAATTSPTVASQTIEALTSTTKAAPKPEIIVMPPVILGERSGYGPIAAPASTATLEEARRIEDKAGDEISVLEQARMLYQQILDADKLDAQSEKLCLERLNELTNRLVLNPKISCSAPKAVLHKVEPGETLERIVKKYKVNQGQAKRINHLNDKLTVRCGQTLKLLPGDVLYKISRHRLIGALYIDGVFIRRYLVGIGPGNATPRGSYIVEKKVMNPDWYYDGKRLPFGDPANILGSRWMGFAANDNGGQGGGLGVHGTSLPESVPGRESKGCVRMLNKDVEELYDFMPQGGKVEIF